MSSSVEKTAHLLFSRWTAVTLESFAKQTFAVE